MPSFGRLSKHSNRSQHTLPEQLSTGAAAGTAPASPAPASAPGALSGAAQTQTQAQAQAQAQAHVQALGAQGQQGGGALAGVAQADSPSETSLPPVLSSATALGSSDHLDTFVDMDARAPPDSTQQQQQQLLHQQQHQQQQHHPLPPPPPVHLFNLQSSGVNPSSSLQASGSGVSPAFDGHQPPTPVDFDPSVSRSQSQHYGASLTPQHHQFYGTASGSIDDLPGSGGGYHQQPQQPQQLSAPAPAPQKRSTRKLIKGIFTSSRDSHDTHHHQQTPPPPPQSSGYNPSGPYDNTTGLARRPSKRDSRILLSNNGIRQVSSEHLETSPYDEVYQPPDHPPPHQQQQQPQQLRNQQTPPPLQQPQPQPLQRQGTLRIQEQQAQYELQQQLQQQQRHGAGYELQSEQGHQQQPNFHYPTTSAPGSYQPGGDPRLIANQLVTSQQLQNPETISQLSHESPVTDSDPRSAFQQHPLQPSQAASLHTSTPSQDIATDQPPVLGTNTQGQDQSAMAPPAPGGGPQTSRRGQDAEKVLRGQADPSGPPPGYQRQGSVSLNAMGPIPPLPGQGVDQGRNSPQPSDRDSDLEKQFKELSNKYKHVKRLYFEGKSQIDMLNGRVEQLQNAVANQRMSQSRTAWDDNEYSTRFNRLNGAINNLSFNIRKDWRSLPVWIDSFVSADALKTGKQEMTAIGRAVVSRWLVEEVFNKCFHPALDTQLSSQLKEIELSIRENSYTMHHQEEVDAHTTKVVNWRMATLDGLQKRLNSNAAADNRGMLIGKVTKNLTTYLHQHLINPPPPGVEGSTSMIAELAVAIAANLPLESRDVSIMYPLPGDLVQTNMMEVEKAGLPPLEGQKADADADSNSDEDDVDEKDKGGKPRGDKGKPGMLQKRAPGTGRLRREDSNASGTKSTNADQDTPGLSNEFSRVRFAGFVALEVRGRQVLMKAPVWTL
ncbi:hypothetical protein J3458_008985 [Metarhizium acridum]|uniref:uncharacterized protein n=1 Tax=Metarhizium acridum TaxID=92637 RepID=UPI001C6CB9D1|nr:hypothetical protein J3458_008985 [Metarhizium acridum]